jgi:hypothetical protein
MPWGAARAIVRGVRPLIVAPCVLIALTLTACRPSGAPVQRFKMEDMQVTEMFLQLAIGLKRPFVLELPARPVNGRFNVELEATSDEAVLDRLAKLDPSFQGATAGDVLLLYPSGAQDLEQSPYSKKLDRVTIDGGAGEAVLAACRLAGIVETTTISIDKKGARRPVKLDLQGPTLRDVFVEIAHQAHLGFELEPGRLEGAAVKE